MEATPLDPNDYDGTYKLIGGRLAFDFLNTISWAATDRRHDWLTSPKNVRLWLEAVGLDAGVLDAHALDAGVLDADVPIRDADIPAIHALRATIHDALSPLAHGQSPSTDAVERLNGHIASVGATRRIDPATLAWGWSQAESALDLFRSVVDDAADILVAGARGRVKHCPSCDWLFEDQTRNGQRRWCDMADCGSRAKSRDYYNRTHKRTQ